MRKYFIFLLILCILGIPQIAMAEEPPDGVIRGSIFNETANGSPVAGDNVTLLAIINGMQEEIQTTEVDNEGKFIIEGLSLENQYILIVNHSEVDYYFQVIFGESETEKSLELSVFDTTNDKGVISTRLAHAIVYIEEGYLAVSQVFWLVNSSDRIYIGDEMVVEGTLVFTLPSGATDFQIPESSLLGYILLPDNKVAFDEAFRPGEIQLVYSYILPWDGSGDYGIPFIMDYPTDEFHVMVEDENIEVSSTKLTLEEPVATEDGRSYLYLSGQDFFGGAFVDVTIRDFSGVNVTVILVSILLPLLVIAIIIFLLIRRRSRGVKTNERNSELKADGQERKLQQEIDQLNDDFQQGLINEEMYRQLTSEKKARLETLVSRQKRETDE